MKYLYKFIIFYYFFLHLLYASPLELTREEKAFIQKHPKIVFGSSKDFEPNVIQNPQGTLKGFDIDIAKEIAKLTGLQIEFKAGIWKDIIQEAKQGKIDVLTSTVHTKEREKNFVFSDPYMYFRKFIFVKYGNPQKIYTPKNLANKKIGVLQNNSVDKHLVQKFVKSEIVYAKDIPQMFQLLYNNRVDLLVGYESFYYLADKYEYPALDTAFEVSQKAIPVVYSVNKELSQLRTILNKALEYMGQKNIEDIKLKWYGNRFYKYSTDPLLLSPEHKKYLQKKGVITMCVDPDWMPFESLQHTKHIGISADYFKIIERRLNIPIKLVPTGSWLETLEFARQRKCDIISMAMRTKNREMFLNFTTPYFEIPTVIATKNDVSFIEDLQHLKGKKIAVIQGYAIIDMLKKHYPMLDLIEVENPQKALEMVSKGKVFGFIDTLASIGYRLKNDFRDNIKISGKFDYDWQMRIGVRRDDPILLDILQKALDSINTYQKKMIYNTWVDIQPKKQKIDYKYVIYFGVILFLLLIIMLYKQNYLKKLNKVLQQKIDEAVGESRQKDKLLFHQNKLASMGKMIGNISHQWRQPLMELSSLHMELEAKVRLEKHISNNELLHSIERANALMKFMSNTIEDFQNFINKQKKKEVFKIEDTLVSTMLILGKTFSKSHIDLDIDIKCDREVHGYKNEYVQVLLNILLNAKDIFEERAIEKRKIDLIIDCDDTNSIVTICDNAGGIDLEPVESIFEPYVSLKKATKNSGMGLFMSKMIIENFESGSLKAYNKGEGACFTILIPLYPLKV